MADITVKICDRCKKEIEQRRGIAVFEPVFIRSILSLELFRTGPYSRQGLFCKNQFDLCEECSNELVWFLGGTELVVETPIEETDV